MGVWSCFSLNVLYQLILINEYLKTDIYSERGIWDIISKILLYYFQHLHCTVNFSSSFTLYFRTQERNHYITMKYLIELCHLHFRDRAAHWAKDLVISNKRMLLEPGGFWHLIYHSGGHFKSTRSTQISMTDCVWNKKTTRQNCIFFCFVFWYASSPAWLSVSRLVWNLAVWEIWVILLYHCSELTKSSSLKIEHLYHIK